MLWRIQMTAASTNPKKLTLAQKLLIYSYDSEILLHNFSSIFFLFLCCLNSLGKAIFKLPQWASITHSGLIIIIKIRPLWSKSCVFFIIAQFISVVFCGPADLIDKKLTKYQFLNILTDRQTDTVRYRSNYPSLKNWK